MSSRAFDLGLAANDWITVLPDLSTPPSVGDVLQAAAVASGVVHTRFTNPTAASGGPYLPLTGGTVSGPLYFTTTGGTASRSAQDRAADRLNVKDFYTGNWDAAFDAAFNALTSAGGTIVVPAGNYTWATPHAWASKPISIIGDGKGVTNIYITHPGVGLTIDQTATNMLFNHTNISDITFFASATSGPTQGAIAILYPYGTSFPQSFARATFTATRVEMLSTGGAAPWANCFLTGISLTGTWMAKLNDIHFFGAPVNPGLVGGYAIGLTQCEDTRITQLYAHYGQTGVMILDHGEGLDLIGPTMVGTDWAIMVAPGATTFPVGPTYLIWNLIQCIDAEMNCYLGILNLRNIQNVTVTNCDMTRFADSGAANWTVFQITDCMYCTLVNNYVSGGGATLSTNRYAVLTYATWACWCNEIHNQVVPNQMGVYTLFSGSPYIGDWNSITWTSSGATFADTGQAVRYGNDTKVVFNDASGYGVGLGIAVGPDNHAVWTGTDASGGSRTLQAIYMQNSTAVLQNYVGLTMVAGANLILDHDPVNVLEPVTLRYGAANYLPSAGGTVNGSLVVTNNHGFGINDTSGAVLNFLMGSDNHFGLYSPNGSGGSVSILDFYAHTPTPVLNFGVPTIQGGGTTIGYSSATDAEVKLLGGAGQWRAISIWAGSTAAAGARWALGSLASAGDDFAINQFSDTGGNLGQPFVISRATGAVQMWNGLGLFGHAPTTARPTVSGAKGSNTALASLITALAGFGFITDSTTA